MSDDPRKGVPLMSGVERLARVLCQAMHVGPCPCALHVHSVERILADPGPLLAALAEAGILREEPSGWTEIDRDYEPYLWTREGCPDVEFEPIRTLADDEVAVKRDDLADAIEHLADHDSDTDPGAPFLARLRAALETGEDRG